MTHRIKHRPSSRRCRSPRSPRRFRTRCRYGWHGGRFFNDKNVCNDPIPAFRKDPNNCELRGSLTHQKVTHPLELMYPQKKGRCTCFHTPEMKGQFVWHLQFKPGITTFKREPVGLFRAIVIFGERKAKELFLMRHARNSVGKTCTYFAKKNGSLRIKKGSDFAWKNSN